MEIKEEHANGAIVKEDNVTVYGSHSTVIGAHCNVFGEHCTVWGKDCTIAETAHHCIIFGDGCVVKGEHAKVAAVLCRILADKFDLCVGYRAYRGDHTARTTYEGKPAPYRNEANFDYSYWYLSAEESKVLLEEKARGPQTTVSQTVVPQTTTNEVRGNDSVVTVDGCHVFGHHCNVWGKGCVIEKSAHHCKVFGERCVVYGEHAKVCAKGIVLYSPRFDLADHLRAAKNEGEDHYISMDKSGYAGTNPLYSNHYLTPQESQALRDEMQAGPKPKPKRGH